MQNNKFLFFIDIDDTLVPTCETIISQEIVEEIKRLNKQGHIFIISTGRALSTTLIIQGIEVFQYLSVLMGNCIYEMPSKKLLKKPQTMPCQEVEKLVKLLESKNIEWSYKDEREEKSIFSDCEFFKEKTKCKIISREEYKSNLSDDSIIQILFLAHLSEEEMKQFPHFEFYLMPHGYTDVALKGFTKAKCVEFFKQKFPNMTTVSIGDSFNDIDMLKATDISIAMGNAKPEVKAITTYETKHINDNGLIYAFRDILGL